MKRYHEEKHIADRHRKAFRRFETWLDRMSSEEIAEIPLGRFRKKHGLDCGKPRCHICHSDKFPVRLLTRQEQKSTLSFLEQIAEL